MPTRWLTATVPVLSPVSHTNRYAGEGKLVGNGELTIKLFNLAMYLDTVNTGVPI